MTRKVVNSTRNADPKRKVVGAVSGCCHTTAPNGMRIKVEHTFEGRTFTLDEFKKLFVNGQNTQTDT